VSQKKELERGRKCTTLDRNGRPSGEGVSLSTESLLSIRGRDSKREEKGSEAAKKKRGAVPSSKGVTLLPSEGKRNTPDCQDDRGENERAIRA